MFGLAMYALMADITTEENRTKRMAVMDAFKFVGIAIGFFLGGIIKDRFGWTHLYLTSMTLIIIDILYVIFFIKESKTLEWKSQSALENNRNTTCWGKSSSIKHSHDFFVCRSILHFDENITKWI